MARGGEKYVYFAEWYNEVAEVIKPFLLSYFPHDQTLEMYDLQCRRMFLRRTKMEQIQANDLYKGALVNIFCRQIRIVDYANVTTAQIYEIGLQKIFFLIKSDAMCKSGKIISSLERAGFKLTRMKLGQITKNLAVKFLRNDTESREEVEALIDGPCLGIEAIGEHGFRRWLEIVGPPDPVLAQAEAPNSLRAAYGTDSSKNAIHVTPDHVVMAQECEMWFAPDNMGIESTCLFENSTCCVVKPHAIQEGKVGAIIDTIISAGFKITAAEIFTIKQRDAEAFYEVYKGIIPEYSSMVSQLVSGPCIAMEVVNAADPPSSALSFRQLVGPVNPITARTTFPNSLRARFGTSTVLNAVHCTDLPEDAKLEVEFFFKLLQN